MVCMFEEHATWNNLKALHERNLLLRKGRQIANEGYEIKETVVHIFLLSLHKK